MARSWVLRPLALIASAVLVCVSTGAQAQVPDERAAGLLRAPAPLPPELAQCPTALVSHPARSWPLWGQSITFRFAGL